MGVLKEWFLKNNLLLNVDRKEHIQQLSTTLAKYNFALRVLTDCVSKQVSLMSFHTCVQSRLPYVMIFRSNTTHLSRKLQSDIYKKVSYDSRWPVCLRVCFVH